MIVFTCILLFTFPPPTALLLSSYLVFINDALDLLVVLLDILIFEGNTTDYDWAIPCPDAVAFKFCVEGMAALVLVPF